MLKRLTPYLVIVVVVTALSVPSVSIWFIVGLYYLIKGSRTK